MPIPRTILPTALLCVSTLLACSDPPSTASPVPGTPTASAPTADAPPSDAPPADAPPSDAPDAPAAATPAPVALDGVPGASPTLAPRPPTGPVLRRLPLLAHLPAGTLAAVAIDAPTALARRLGRDAALAAFGPDHPLTALRADLRALTGHDLTDPAAWPALGLSPDHPVGLALLSIDPPIIALGATLTDPAHLRSLLYAYAFGHVALREDTRADATLISGAELAVGLRGDDAWLVVGENLLPGEALAHARAIADATAIPPAAGRALDALGDARDLALYLDSHAITDAVLARLTGDPAARRAQRALAAADALGDPDAAAAARARLADADPAALGKSTVAAVARALLAPIGPAAIGLTVERRAIRVRYAQALEAGSDIAAVVRARPGPRPLAPVFDRPLAMIDLVVDPRATLAIGGATALGLGAPWPTAEIRAALGAPPETLADALTGGLGLALALTPGPPMQTPTELLGRLEAAAYLGLRDPAAARAALAHLAEQGLARPAETDTWTLTLAGRPITLRLRQNRLLAATTPALIDRIATDDDSFTAERRPPVRTLLDGAEGGSAAWLDIAALADLMLTARPIYDTTPLPPGDPAFAVRELEIQIEALRAAHRETERKRGRALFDALGALAITVDPTPGGLHARGGLFVGADDVPTALATLIRFAIEQQRAGPGWWAETTPLEDRRRQLLDGRGTP